MLKSLLFSLWGRRRSPDAGDIDTAVSYFHAGRLDDAGAIAQRILRVNPGDAKAWNLLGGIAIERGDERATTSYFEDAAALAPAETGIVTNLAESKRRTGDLDGAEALDPAQIASEHVGLARRIMVPERRRRTRHTSVPDPERCLRVGYVTFGAVNGAPKLSPRWVALWADLLAEAPQFRLILAAIPAGTAQGRLREMISQRGIDRLRIVIRERLPYLKFWALHHEIDIALDTYPCNGGTTACETAWLGVPMATLAGERYGGNRLGTSTLVSLGLSHLAATTPPEYRAITRSLAAGIPQLAALRRELGGRMRASALTDRDRFMRNLERRFRDIWRQWCAGQAR